MESPTLSLPDRPDRPDRTATDSLVSVPLSPDPVRFSVSYQQIPNDEPQDESQAISSQEEEDEEACTHIHVGIGLSG